MGGSQLTEEKLKKIKLDTLENQKTLDNEDYLVQKTLDDEDNKESTNQRTSQPNGYNMHCHSNSDLARILRRLFLLQRLPNSEKVV